MPRPPLMVVGGRLRIVDIDGDGASAGVAAGEKLRPLYGRQRGALTRQLDQSASSAAAVPDGLLESCTCGHLYLSGDE